MSCEVGEATEGLENELWRMSCDVGKATEGLENELRRRRLFLLTREKSRD